MKESRAWHAIILFSVTNLICFNNKNKNRKEGEDLSKMSFIFHAVESNETKKTDASYGRESFASSSLSPWENRKWGIFMDHLTNSTSFLCFKLCSWVSNSFLCDHNWLDWNWRSWQWKSSFICVKCGAFFVLLLCNK